MDAVNCPCVVAVSGVKNSGKTTFLVKLVRELTGRGKRVVVIKHDGHDFQADVEGTDTWRMLEAGAYGTCIYSKNKWMSVKKEENVNAEEMILRFPEADIILIEGLKHSSFPKFELVRKGVSNHSVCNPDTLLALVTDTELEIPGVLSLGMEDISVCADIIEKHM